MKEKRDEIIILRLTKTEKNRIYEKMFSMGIRSLSAYIRKMALDGYCLNLDLPQLRRMAYLLQNCSNNLNQYAKAANENGRVYAADMEDLRQRLDELIDIVSVIFIELAKIPSFFGFSEVAKAPKQLIKTNASIRTIQTVFFT